MGGLEWQKAPPSSAIRVKALLCCRRVESVNSFISSLQLTSSLDFGLLGFKFCVFNPIAYEGGGGGGGGRGATTLQPFYLGLSKLLSSHYTLWAHCGEISEKFIIQGGSAAVICRTKH